MNVLPAGREPAYFAVGWRDFFRLTIFTVIVAAHSKNENARRQCRRHRNEGSDLQIHSLDHPWSYIGRSTVIRLLKPQSQGLVPWKSGCGTGAVAFETELVYAPTQIDIVEL